jgi:adenosylcobinamide-phosphate guanylyltransferase
MAGGKATRMGGVEKPMALLAGRPLIARVLDRLLECESVDRLYVALSARAPETASLLSTEYATQDRVTAFVTPGDGYVEDTAYAVRHLRLFRPFLIVSADLPFLSSGLVDEAVSRYEESGAEALSVRVDAACLPPGFRHDLVLTDDGVRNVPAGVNIVDGRHMDRAQRELLFIVREPGMAVNVNYADDLAVCEKTIGDVRLHRQV